MPVPDSAANQAPTPDSSRHVLNSFLAADQTNQAYTLARLAPGFGPRIAPALAPARRWSLSGAPLREAPRPIAPQTEREAANTRQAAPSPSPCCLSGDPLRTTLDRAPARPLPFFYDLYTFRGQADRTTVVAAFAVPAGKLERRQADNAVGYRFGMTLILADTALRTVFQADDSVFVRFARPLAGEHLLYTQIEVQAPPSTSTLQRVIMIDANTPGIGQLYSSRFPIPDYSGSHLMLSDIALGQPGATAGWNRGRVTLALLPTSQFPESSFDVYYEVYNLPSGNAYATEIWIEQVNDSGAPIDEVEPVRLRFSGESAAGPDGSLPELRRVEAALAKGRYRMTVTIRDEETGQTANRSRLFQVRGWAPGATMVAAIPRGSRRARVGTR